MLLTFQDRLRIPWHGGAKQVSFEAICTVITVPLVIGVAALNAYAFFIMVLASSVFVGYAYVHVRRTNTRTRFFCMWALWSVVCMIVLFEFAVPLLELLPEENLILVLLSCACFYCLYRTRQRSKLNQVTHSLVGRDELPDIVDLSVSEEKAETISLLQHDVEATPQSTASTRPTIVCDSCRKLVAARTAHCPVCGVCVLRRDHHSFWLDCCIGQWNHSYYVFGLVFGELALLLGADLILTAVCHPFLVVRVLGIPVLLPDDCSEVFDDYALAVSFVVSVYSLLMASYICVVLVKQIYLISRGITAHECRQGQRTNHKGFLTNWKAFLF